MIDIVKQQLERVEYADLSHFNVETYTYHIKRRVDIKLDVDNCYLIKIKPSARNNFAVITNWNNGSVPQADYLKVDVSKVMGKMVKVVGVAYDYEKQQDLASFWSGWLSIDDLEIISKL